MEADRVTLPALRRLFLYCSVINYLLLILWFVILRLPHQWLYQMSGVPFGLSTSDFDRLNLTAMVVYKVAIILFNIVPCVSLYIVRLKPMART